GQTECFHESGQPGGMYPGPWSDRPQYIAPNELAEVVGICGVTGTSIWDRQEFLRAGGYKADLRWHCDWFPLQVVAFRRGVCFLPRRTAVVRLTSASYSAGQESLEQREVLQKLLAALMTPEY